MRAAVAEILADRALPDHDYVLIARQETATMPWPDLLRDLETACRRIKAWRA
jgi:ribonuclease P protein component